MTRDDARLNAHRTEVVNSAPSSLSASRSFAYSVLPYLIAAVLCVLVLIPAWHLRRIDLTVPLGIVSDHNLSQEMVAIVVRDVHYYVNPLLGAPGQLELYEFPQLLWIHLIILAVIKLFTRDPGLAINVFYFLSYPLVAVTSLYAFRRLGISTGLAIAGAVLYAFIPFHQLRNEAHLIYSCYYVVPMMALVAVWISTGHELFRFRRKDTNAWSPRVTRDGLISLLVCVVIGWDNPYYACFGVALLAVGGLLGWLRSENRRSLLSAAILTVVLASSFGIGLLPNLIYVHRHGRGPAAQRFPVESEIYGLTLVQMLVPVTNHRLPALAKWKDQFNRTATLVNENDIAALGVVGSAGLLALLVCLFLRRCPDILYSLSVLNLFAILLGTIGGFGAVISFLISPQLRGFNRISVYVSFFSICAVLVILDWLISKWIYKAPRAIGLVILPSLLLLIGIPDQVPRGLLQGRDAIEKEFRQEGRFVQEIEGLVPPHSMIFQLPYDQFPESPPIYAMTDYDELKGYLHSGSLRWSYGAMKGRAGDKWLAVVSREPVDQMLLTIAATGFGGIYIDRFGYPDRASALESQLRSLLGGEPIVSESGRLSFFLLGGKALAFLNRQIPPERLATLEEALYPLIVDVADGCGEKEGSDTDNWHWCGRHGKIDIVNTSKSERKILLEATFTTAFAADSNLLIDGAGIQDKMKVNSSGAHWQAVVVVPQGESTINLSSDANQVVAPGDPRDLFFRINNFRYHEVGR